jgi:hypothetical protein
LRQERIKKGTEREGKKKKTHRSKERHLFFSAGERAGDGESPPPRPSSGRFSGMGGR